MIFRYIYIYIYIYIHTYIYILKTTIFIEKYDNCPGFSMRPPILRRNGFFRSHLRGKMGLVHSKSIYLKFHAVVEVLPNQRFKSKQCLPLISTHHFSNLFQILGALAHAKNQPTGAPQRSHARTAAKKKKLFWVESMTLAPKIHRL